VNPLTCTFVLHPCMAHTSTSTTAQCGNFPSRGMGISPRDSNSHEFEDIVDPITCMSNEELEEIHDEIDETLTEKESNVATAFSWSNVSSQNRGGATKRSKIDNSVIVIDSTPASPQ